LIKLAEYLTQRDDIDPKKIGITGISLGGQLYNKLSSKICIKSNYIY